MSKHVTMATWDDVPHLTAEDKARMLESIPPFQRDARSKGVPQLGAGAIYPVPESDVFIPAFAIPPYWRRGYGMDVGWNTTAVLFGAIDPEADTIYLYDEIYLHRAEPATVSAAIRARGEWLPGVIDPASRGRGQKDGEQLLQAYQDQGLVLSLAENGVEAGLLECWHRMTTGRLKIFSHLQNTKTEYRLYRRDEKGHVVKKLDHAMDAKRYFVVSGIHAAIQPPDYLHRLGHRSLVTSDYDPHANL